MGYAFENTPWHELPPGEQLAILIMQAQIRDGMLTVNEHMWKCIAEREARDEQAAWLKAIGHPAYAEPVLAVGESKDVTAGGQRYKMTRVQ